MRNEVSVPGIKNDRGKLPVTIGAPAPAPGACWPNPGTYCPGAGALGGGACESWSMRFWRSSWLARKSASSSALDAAEPVSNKTAATDPPTAATLERFRLLIMAPPCSSGAGARAGALVLGPQYGTGGSDQVRFYRLSGVFIAAWQRCNRYLQAIDFAWGRCRPWRMPRAGRNWLRLAPAIRLRGVAL